MVVWIICISFLYAVNTCCCINTSITIQLVWDVVAHWWRCGGSLSLLEYVVGHWLDMWWFIGGDVVAHWLDMWWFIGRYVVARWLEMWWLIAWRCGGSLADMWWLIGGDVVAHWWRFGGSLVERWWPVGEEVVNHGSEAAFPCSNPAFSQMILGCYYRVTVQYTGYSV